MHKYIINIEFNTPIESCAECPLCYDDLYCTAKGDNNDNKIDYAKRPDNCPLKEVNEK